MDSILLTCLHTCLRVYNILKHIETSDNLGKHFLQQVVVSSHSTLTSLYSTMTSSHHNMTSAQNTLTSSDNTMTSSHSTMTSSQKHFLPFFNDIVHFTISGVYVFLSSQSCFLPKNQIIYSFDKRNRSYFFKIYQKFIIEAYSTRIINNLHLSDLFIFFYIIW